MDSSLEIEVVLNVRYSKIMPKFLELRQAELEVIATAISAEDFATLARIGHNLRGAGASYGLEMVSALGTRIEEAARVQESQVLSGLLNELENFVRNVHLTYRNTILFVDDQPELLRLLRGIFAGEEYICYFASSGVQALDILSEQPVDVLICDLMMPEMNGLELLTLVRQRFPNVVRLVLSADSQTPSILDAINSGEVFRYLTKPLRIDEQTRATLADAMARANELNHYEPHHLQVELKTMINLLQSTKQSFVLVGRGDRIVASSENFQDVFPRGQHFDSKLERHDHDFMQPLSLDRWHAVWIVQEDDKSS